MTGTGGTVRQSEAEYCSRDSGRADVHSYELVGDSEMPNCNLYVAIDTKFFDLFEPRIGGYLVFDEEDNPSYMRGHFFRTNFHLK